jgi:predicted hydrolase (HD superfamily)
MKVKSVTKKLKERSFAANVNRQDIQAGADLLGMPLAELIEHGIAALRPAVEELGLAPPSGA